MSREVIHTLGKSCTGAAQTEQFKIWPAAISAVFLARCGDVNCSVRDWYHKISICLVHAAMSSKQIIDRTKKRAINQGKIVLDPWECKTVKIDGKSENGIKIACITGKEAKENGEKEFIKT